MIAALLVTVLTAAPPAFQELSPGLEIGELAMPEKSTHGDSTVTVLRFDPERYELVLLSAKALSLPDNLDAPTWAAKHKLLAVANAAMFDIKDMRTPVGYAHARDKVLNAKWNKNYGAVIATGPKSAGLPRVQILDGDCDDLKKTAPRYASAIQTIRMVDCKGQNRWTPRQKKWSAVVLATDTKGRVLIIHSRSPYEPHAFVDHLLALPLDIARMAYLEGGPEASLYVNAGGKTIERVGSFETGFNENDDNRRFWPLPNVLGLRARAP